MEGSSSSKRRERDLMKLMMNGYKVNMSNEANMHEFEVKFYGPKETPYELGIWKVKVNLPPEYPFKSPSIGFINRLYHPNVDDLSGSVCLDVINQSWSPLYDLLNVFETFLPQLLRYPNPSDPLNGEAAALLLNSPEQYRSKVKDYVVNYASSEVNMDSDDEGSDAEGSDAEGSDVAKMSDMED